MLINFVVALSLIVNLLLITGVIVFIYRGKNKIKVHNDTHKEKIEDFARKEPNKADKKREVKKVINSNIFQDVYIYYPRKETVEMIVDFVLSSINQDNDDTNEGKVFSEIDGDLVIKYLIPELTSIKHDFNNDEEYEKFKELLDTNFTEVEVILSEINSVVFNIVNNLISNMESGDFNLEEIFKNISKDMGIDIVEEK